MAEWTQAEWEKLFGALMRRSNEPGHFTGELGLTVTKIERFFAEGEITPDHRVCNPRGILHGGAVYTLMDHVAGIAACTTGRGCVTLDTSISYLRPAQPHQKLRVTAEVVKPGGHIVVCSASVFDAGGKELARGSFTFYMMEELGQTLHLRDEAAEYQE